MEIRGYKNIFDSHAHYNDPDFDEDRKALIDDLPRQGVCAVINIGANYQTSLESVELSRQYPGFYATVGYHPHDAKDYREEEMEQLLALVDRKKVVGIGEIGLDYHYDLSPRESQQAVFERQCALAEEHDLPISVHSREATQDTLEILSRHPRLRGVIHCFSGSAETAKTLLNMGFYLSFTGVVTFKNARKTVEAAAVVPLDRLLLETDSPYMAPVPYRGKRCWSPMIAETAAKIAEIKDVDPQTLIDQARRNTCLLFGIAETDLLEEKR